MKHILKHTSTKRNHYITIIKYSYLCYTHQYQHRLIMSLLAPQYQPYMHAHTHEHLHTRTDTHTSPNDFTLQLVDPRPGELSLQLLEQSLTNHNK